MANKINKIIESKLNTLLETKGFEDMEVAFGVKHKSDNLSDAEKKQFGSLESVQDKETGVVKLGASNVQPALNKVHKEDSKDAEEYYKMVLDRMRNFQKTDTAEQSQIGEAFKPKKVNREDDQTKEEEVYSTEALGAGGMLALRYDNEETPVYDEFVERIDKLNGNDSTYEKLRMYSKKYLKHKYEEPNEYHYTPKVRTTEKPVNEEKYSDVISENIFKVKGEIKSKEQIIKLTEKLPSRVKIDETVFAITDGENYYRLIWEGEQDGEAIITHEKNSGVVTESIGKMKYLWGYKSSNTSSAKNILKETEEDKFKKMFRKLKNK